MFRQTTSHVLPPVRDIPRFLSESSGTGFTGQISPILKQIIVLSHPPHISMYVPPLISLAINRTREVRFCLKSRRGVGIFYSLALLGCVSSYAGAQGSPQPTSSAPTSSLDSVSNPTSPSTGTSTPPLPVSVKAPPSSSLHSAFGPHLEPIAETPQASYEHLRGIIHHRSPKSEIVVGIPNHSQSRGHVILNQSGQSDGYARQLIQAAATCAGINVKFVTLEMGDVYEPLRNGTVDLIVGVSVRPDALHTVAYSSPLYIARGVLLSNASRAKLSDPKELESMRVGVAKAGIAHAWCLARGMSPIVFSSLNAARHAAARGEVDYVLTTQIGARADAELYPVAGLIEHPFNAKDFWLTFAAASRIQDGALIADLNAGLAIIKQMGIADEIYDRTMARYQPRDHTRQFSFWTIVFIVCAFTSLVLLVTLAWRYAATALARRTKELSESRTQLEALSDNIPGLVYTYIRTPSGHCIPQYINKQSDQWMQRFPHLLSAYSEGREISINSIHPNDRERYLVASSASRETTTPFELEFRTFDCNQQERWIYTRIIPLPRPDGILWQGLSLDVTDLRQAQTEREKLTEQLQHSQKLESLGIMASGIAHDFNNLLAVVIGNASIASRLCGMIKPNPLPGTTNNQAPKTQLSSLETAESHLQAEADRQPLHHALTQIELSARKAADLTRQMLTFAGKSPVMSRSIHINALIEEILPLLKTTAQPGVSIHFAPQDNISAVHADPTQLHQVVLNLVVNASEALADRNKMQAGTPSVPDAPPPVYSAGRVHIRTCKVTLDPGSTLIIGDAAALGTCICIEVSDNGPGMSQQTLRSILDPFFTTKFTGRGLGLSVVTGIIKRHNGGLCIQSTVGEGTTFRVYLPEATVTNRDAASSFLPPRTSGHSSTPHSSSTPLSHFKAASPSAHIHRIALVVDDEDLVRDVTMKQLQTQGWMCIGARNGHEAIELMKQATIAFDIALIDVTMPDISGMQVMKTVREYSPKLPIVMMSGCAIEVLDPSAQGDGKYSFLPKPFMLEDLVSCIAEALSHDAVNSDTPAPDAYSASQVQTQEAQRTTATVMHEHTSV